MHLFMHSLRNMIIQVNHNIYKPKNAVSEFKFLTLFPSTIPYDLK